MEKVKKKHFLLWGSRQRNINCSEKPPWTYKPLHGYTTSMQLLMSLQKAWDKCMLGTVNSLKGSSRLLSVPPRLWLRCRFTNKGMNKAVYSFSAAAKHRETRWVRWGSCLSFTGSVFRLSERIESTRHQKPYTVLSVPFMVSTETAAKLCSSPRKLK